MNYLTRSEKITADGGANPERIQGAVVPEWWPAEREGFEYFVRNNLRTVGASEVSRVLVQSTRITPANTVEVGVIACVTAHESQVKKTESFFNAMNDSDITIRMSGCAGLASASLASS